jgi:hypothetical protein
MVKTVIELKRAPVGEGIEIPKIEKLRRDRNRLWGTALAVQNLHPVSVGS